MKILKLCLAQINPTVGDLNGNANKIIKHIDKARGLDADIVVFPELSLSGYPPEDLLLKPHFIKECEKNLLQIVKASNSIFSIVGFPYLEKSRLFNAAALSYNSKLADVYKKVFLPNYGVFDEKRYFTSGNKCNVIALGKDIKIGITICEDIWHPEGPQRTQALLAGARIIINISSSPYRAQKVEERERMLKKRARENNAFILYCNLVGAQDELVFDGASMAFDNNGRLMARAKQFEEDILVVNIDTRLLKGKVPIRKRMMAALPRASIKQIRLPAIKEKARLDRTNRLEKRLKHLEEIYAALVLGIRDYVKKNNFGKVVLGLSGGIDSALTAVLAKDSLGKENVIALTMPSIYSTSGTKQDSKRIAHNLGIRLIVVPIREIYKRYIDSFAIHFKSRKRGITEENIQARIRGNLLMAFSNKFGWLVLTTGNKSEISTGYCTLYGDMAGGFAVLKDVPKGLVYKLAKYRNSLEKKEIIPKSVFKRAPSAELKKNQKDQDTLPPYAILDKIIDLYVEKDKSIDEIVSRGFDRNTVNKIVFMIDSNEYKRRQAPPGIKITPRAFGKDRRMPITNLFSQILKNR